MASHGHPRSGVGPVQPWSVSTLKDAKRRAEEWLLCPALTDLVSKLGGPVISLGHLDQVCAWSAATLDTRRGRERWDVPPVEHLRAASVEVLAAAEALGLLQTPPPQDRAYDLVVVLGGSTTGNRLRTDLARAILRDVRAGCIVALASDRLISPSELSGGATEASDDRTEWRHLLRLFEDAFGPLVRRQSVRGPKWVDKSYDSGQGLPVRLVVAPAPKVGRSTTRSQLRFLRQRVDVPMRRSVLLVTNAIYVPYQFFAGAGELLHDDGRVEVIGTPTETEGDLVRLVQRVAQEIHAALEAAVELVNAVR